MTPTLVLHGKQLVGYVVILKYAKCDGRSLNKRLTNTVKSRLLTSPRQKTKRLYNTTKGKKECLPLYCQACMLGVSFTALGFVLLSANFSVAIYFPLVLVIMAYSSDYVRMVPDRSRSRDDPMWHHRSYSRQSNSQYRDVWREVPPVRQPRRVLIIVDLEPVSPTRDSCPWRHHGINNMLFLTFFGSDGRICSVHLQCPGPSISHRNSYGEHLAVLY